MAAMDTTQTPQEAGTPDAPAEVDDLLERLAAADPAEAAPVAEEVATVLTDHLDASPAQDRHAPGGAGR
jgi:hypothetical protein